MFSVPEVGGRPPRDVSREALTLIIQPRMEEIFSLAAKEIKRSDFGDLLGAGLVLTGGGSLLEGCVSLAEEIFGLPVKVGVPKGFIGLMETTSNPIYATGIGLVLYGLENEEGVKDFKEDETKWWDRILQIMRQFVKDFF